MGFESKELKLPALGRPAFLGQLYNASSEALLNKQLFTQTINSEEIPNSFTSVKYKDINTITDRANALDISAELSVGILGGMIELKGSGQYLDTSKSNVSSREVSMVCTVRKCLKRLSLDSNTVITRTVFEKAVKGGASHVITGIVYGGTLITNITEKASNAESKNHIHGEFSASIMKGMAGKFSAEGKAAVDVDKTSKDVLENRDFDVYGDYASSQQPNPTTVGDLFELAKKWPELVGEGVPLEVIATPLTDLVDDSVEAKILHELESDELTAILALYDHVYRLAGRRSRVQAALEAGLGQYCPTFLDRSRQRKSITDGILGRSRKALAKYLINHRDGGVEKAGDVEKFLEDVKKGYLVHIKDCEEDESMLGLLQSLKDVANRHKCPLVPLSDLRQLMTRAAHGMVGVVLIPPTPNVNNIVNTYDVLVQSIRRWRTDEDKNELDPDGKATQTVFVTYYCDESLTKELLDLDGTKGVLKKALNGFNQSKDSRFVHYGMLPTKLVQKEFGWSLLNDEGWAFLPNEEESWFYVGQVSGGKRHGRGTVTYADQSTYSGDWWKDTPHGQGEHIEGDKHTVGVFIDGQYRSDGAIVDLKIITGHQLTRLHRVPLRKGDASTSHVFRIGKMLGWTDAEEYKLLVTCNDPIVDHLELLVVGKLLKAGQEKLSNRSWPLDKGVVIKVEKRN